MVLAHVDLASGRSIELMDVRMSSTYGGWLEGYPSARMNDRKVSAAVTAAERAFPGSPVHLVPPVRERPDAPSGPFGPVEVLPAVTCVGAFTSNTVDEELDSGLHLSRLVVVWFQASFGAVGPELRDLAWDEAARDVER